jgi:hypothetical protein
MIEKIEILQHGEYGNFVGHPCEKASTLLRKVAYPHELVVKLRKDRLDSLSESLVGPYGLIPVLLS